MLLTKVQVAKDSFLEGEKRKGYGKERRPRWCKRPAPLQSVQGVLMVFRPIQGEGRHVEYAVLSGRVSENRSSMGSGRFSKTLREEGILPDS
jgi:hypothetical protein